MRPRRALPPPPRKGHYSSGRPDRVPHNRFRLPSPDLHDLIYRRPSQRLAKPALHPTRGISSRAAGLCTRSVSVYKRPQVGDIASGRTTRTTAVPD